MNDSPDRRPIVLAVFALLAAGVVVAILLARSGGGTADSLLQHCKESPVGAPNHFNLHCPDVKPPPEGSTAVFDTSKGQFTVSLDTKDSPLTTASFAYLVGQQLYTKTKFHRIIPGFVIQGGDPLGTGAGGPGYSVIEPPPPGTQYTRGVVAMAKTGSDPPGTLGSQFFVVAGADAGLPAEYALLGKVIKGIDVVERIAKLGTSSGQPRKTVFLDKVTIRNG